MAHLEVCLAVLPWIGVTEHTMTRDIRLQRGSKGASLLLYHSVFREGNCGRDLQPASEAKPI